MRELEHSRFQDKVKKYLEKLGDNSHLNTQQLAELAIGLELVLERYFIEKSVPKSTHQGESFWYQADTDSLGYQTGDFPKETWFRDRDDE